MAKLRFALFGTGFWSPYQLAGWEDAGGVECVALYNRTLSKAQAVADQFNIPAVYDDPEELLDNEKIDFMDICTNVETHSQFTKMGAARGLDIVCQKPMAVTLDEAEEMVAVCREADVKFLINENFRWQSPIRQFKDQLEKGNIGKPFRARIHYCSSFPFLENQPFLADLEEFLLTDVGSHILDVARCLFGEARSLYCQIDRIHPQIKGEDVVTVMMRMENGMTVVIEMSFATRSEIERFPQTYVYVEGNKGYLELGPDYWIRETTEEGTFSKRYPPMHYPWADAAFDLIHSSIVPCQVNLSQALKGETIAETRGEDNINTIRLIFASYQSARSGEVVHFE